MLRYLGSGLRQFGIYPITHYARVSWEFYGVIRGSIAPILPGAEEFALKSQHLWLFPPGHSHGWTGDGTHNAQVIVFHFSFVPPPLDEIARRNGYMSVDLTGDEAQRLLEIEEGLREYYHQSTPVNLLHFHKALLDLSLLALKNEPVQKRASWKEDAAVKVEAALAWFSERLGENPNLEQAARAVHVSTSHLRRLFHQVRKESPQIAFTHVKIERAMGMLTESAYKSEVIASMCGFSSSANFCRVFKAQTGKTPAAWKKARLGP